MKETGIDNHTAQQLKQLANKVSSLRDYRYGGGDRYRQLKQSVNKVKSLRDYVVSLYIYDMAQSCKDYTLLTDCFSCRDASCQQRITAPNPKSYKDDTLLTNCFSYRAASYRDVSCREGVIND